jgi:hypothetical protein
MRGQGFLRVCGTRKSPDGVLTTEYEFRHLLYRDMLSRRLSLTQRVSQRGLAESLKSMSSSSDNQPENVA